MTTREPETVTPTPEADARKHINSKLDKAIESMTRAADLLYDVKVDLPKDPDAVARLLDESTLERFIELTLRASSAQGRASVAASVATSAMAQRTTVGTAIDAAQRVAKVVQEKLQREDDATCQCDKCKRTRGRA